VRRGSTWYDARMTEVIQFFTSLPVPLRIVGLTVLAVVFHLIVRTIRQLAERLLTFRVKTVLTVQETFSTRFPKTATLVTILVSSFTFTIYFVAVGLVLREFNVSLRTYLASASVIGLAIGFGTQGFVQDVISGLTLIFSSALNIEDVVEIAGQVGRVEKIGLRFTTLIDIRGQRIFLPNRNIGIISQFRDGAIRAYVDIQLPTEVDDEVATRAVKTVADALYSQHHAVILSKPEVFGVVHVENLAWRYLRIKMTLWPGQEGLIEKTFKPRVIEAMKQQSPDFADWMVIATLKGQ